MNVLISLLPLIIIGSYILICIVFIRKIIKNTVLLKSDKTFWILMILCMPFLGSLIYIFKNKE